MPPIRPSPATPSSPHLSGRCGSPVARVASSAQLPEEEIETQRERDLLAMSAGRVILL